jgi:hypothetical protein
MIVTIFFCKINIILLLDKLTTKIIPYVITEWKYATWTHLQVSTLQKMKNNSIMYSA